MTHEDLDPTIAISHAADRGRRALVRGGLRRIPVDRRLAVSRWCVEADSARAPLAVAFKDEQLTRAGLGVRRVR